MEIAPPLSDERVAAYCAARDLSSVNFERTVLQHALRSIGVQAVAGRALPPLRMRLMGVVSERARAQAVLWQRLRDYVTWSVASEL